MAHEDFRCGAQKRGRDGLKSGSYEIERLFIATESPALTLLIVVGYPGRIGNIARNSSRFIDR